MEFSRQEYWSGLPFPTARDIPGPEMEPASLLSPALASGFFTLYHLKPISVMCLHISYPSWPCLPAPRPTPPGHHRALIWAPCNIQQVPTTICFTHGSVYMSMLLSQSVPPFLSHLCPYVHSLHLGLYSCPGNRSTLPFFQSPCICINPW